jgi:hypothetical protein
MIGPNESIMGVRHHPVKGNAAGGAVADQQMRLPAPEQSEDSVAY